MWVTTNHRDIRIGVMLPRGAGPHFAFLGHTWAFSELNPDLDHHVSGDQAMLRGAAGHGEDLAREILTLGLGPALPFEILLRADVRLRRGGHVDLLLRGALYPPADTGIIPGRG